MVTGTMSNKTFWKNKKVLITGNTGFKGSWLTILLLEKKAKIIGISKKERKGLFLFNFLKLKNKISQYYLDIKNSKKIEKVIVKEKPDIIFHMAAQPIVRESYINPINTLETNVLGTINILNSLQKLKNRTAFINITTDKVYKQNKKNNFSEKDPLGGNDIYSSSKACSDIITHSFYKSFFEKKNIGIATARAGNVIGGFDWSKNRIIPDTIRASFQKTKLLIRMPKSIRPWQHVLDVVNGYLKLSEKLYKNPYKYSGSWNFGPNKSSNKDVYTLVSKLSKVLIYSPKIVVKESNFHEEKSITLNSNKSKKELGWKQNFNFIKTIKLTANIYELYNKNLLKYDDFKKQAKLLKK